MLAAFERLHGGTVRDSRSHGGGPSVANRLALRRYLHKEIFSLIANGDERIVGASWSKVGQVLTLIATIMGRSSIRRCSATRAAVGSRGVVSQLHTHRP